MPREVCENNLKKLRKIRAKVSQFNRTVRKKQLHEGFVVTELSYNFTTCFFNLYRQTQSSHVKLLVDRPTFSCIFYPVFCFLQSLDRDQAINNGEKRPFQTFLKNVWRHRTDKIDICKLSFMHVSFPGHRSLPVLLSSVFRSLLMQEIMRYLMISCLMQPRW